MEVPLEETEQTRGFPPKVLPCDPGVNKLLAFLFPKHAPIGTPLPNPLAHVTMSGLIFAC